MHKIPLYLSLCRVKLAFWGDTDISALYDAEIDTGVVLAQIKASNMFLADFAHVLSKLKTRIGNVNGWTTHPMKLASVYGSARLARYPWTWRKRNVVTWPAFGTGTHPTTALCLEWAWRVRSYRQNRHRLRLGSGILAIAAIKLGAEKVIGIDIDPQALLASKDNAERNEAAEQLEVFLPQRSAWRFASRRCCCQHSCRSIAWSFRHH